MESDKNLYVSCDGPGWGNWCVRNMLYYTFPNEACAADYVARNVELIRE